MAITLSSSLLVGAGEDEDDDDGGKGRPVAERNWVPVLFSWHPHLVMGYWSDDISLIKDNINYCIFIINNIIII